MNDEIRYNDFIEKLYNSPSSTPQDKERIVKLLLSERGKGYVTEERVMELLDKYLCKKTNNTNDESDVNQKAIEKNDLRYITPTYLSDFLCDYNKDPVLHYTCHTIDSEDVIEDICNRCNSYEYNFEAHQQLILNHFDELLLRYKSENKYIDNKIIALIYTYITGKNKNGEKRKWANKFEDSWGDDKIKEWAIHNPRKVPNPGINIKSKLRYEGYLLSQQYLSPLLQTPITGFDDLVLCFKSLYHIKRDNSIEDIISPIEEKYSNTVFERDIFHKEMELFTNVLDIQRAYDKIIRMSVEGGGGEKIITSFYNDQSGNKFFVVKDCDSVYMKTVYDIVDRPGGTTDEIIRNLNGVCNVYLQADFSDEKSYSINIWNGQRRNPKPIDKVGGVKYILEFKKNVDK